MENPQVYIDLYFRIPDALDIFEDPLRPGPCWNLPGGAGKNVFNLFPSKPSPLLELPDPLLEHASPLLNHSESLLDSPKPYLALSNTLLEKPEPQIEILDRSVPLKQHPGRVKESFLTDHGLNNPTPVRSDKLQEPPAPVYSQKPSPSLKRGNLALNTVREVKHARLEPVRTLSCEPVNLDNCDNSLNEAGDTPEEENLLPVRISSSLKLVPAGGGRRKINLLPKELVSSTSNSICPNNLGYCEYILLFNFVTKTIFEYFNNTWFVCLPRERKPLNIVSTFCATLLPTLQLKVYFSLGIKSKITDKYNTKIS